MTTEDETIKTYLLNCIRQQLSPQEKVALPPGKHLNWSEILQHTQELGILPLVHPTLFSRENKLAPSLICQQSKKYCTGLSIRNLHMVRHLAQVLNLLRENNIEAIPFKGAVIAQMAYNSISLREFTDLDILVSENNAIQTKNILLQNGYSTNLKLGRKQEQQFINQENFFSLINTDQQIVIDLHWELSGRYNLVPLTFAMVCEDLQTVQLSGIQFKTLSLEKTFVYLCIHATSHCWSKPEWLIALGYLVKNNPEMDWNFVFTWAKQLRCETMVLLGMYLIQDVLKMAIAFDLPDKQNTVYIISKQIADSLFANSPDVPEISWRFSPIHIRVRDTLLDKCQYLGRLYFRPTIAEWQQLTLPSQLTFFYFIFRPVRLIWSLLCHKLKQQSL